MPPERRKEWDAMLIEPTPRQRQRIKTKALAAPVTTGDSGFMDLYQQRRGS